MSTGRTEFLGRTRAIVLAAALGLAITPSQALAPALLLMIKQIGQQAATSMIKDSVLSGLDGLGCKGIALSNALNALDGRRGVALPNMPTIATLPPGMNLPGLPQGASIPPEMAARLGTLMPNAGQLPPGLAMDPEQMAMMARMQQAMAQPLSPPQTLAMFDELSELGFLPKAMRSELQECMVLVPAAVPALGMGMGMLQPVIPQLRRARDELRALSPAEQDEVAAALAQEVQALPPDQRAALMEHIDSGFFPPRVSAGVKAQLAARQSK